MPPVDVGAQPLTYVVSKRDFEGFRLDQINTATGAATAAIPIPGGSSLAISPDGMTAYVPYGALHAVDLSTHVVTSTGVGTQLGPLVRSRDATRLFMVDYALSNRLLVFNTSTRSVEATVELPWAPQRLVVSPDGSRAYVVRNGEDISAIDVATATIIATYPSPSYGVAEFGNYDLIVSADGRRLFVSYSANGFNSIVALDATTGAPLGQLDMVRFVVPSSVLPGYSTPSGMAVLPDSTKLYVLLSAASTSGSRRFEEIKMAVVDTADMTVSRLLPLLGGQVVGEYTIGKAVTAADDGSMVVAVGGFGTAVIDPVDDEFVLRGPDVFRGRYVYDVALGARPHCFAEVSTRRVLMRQMGGQTTVRFPVANDCDWSATTTDSFFSLSPQSGRGPADIIVDVPSAANPGKGSFLLSSQVVEVEQVIAETHIDTSGRVSQPFYLSGWTAERRVGASTPGVFDLTVTAVSESTSRSLPVVATARADVAAAFGQPYLNAGFTQRVTRLPAGVYTVTAQAKSLLDGALLTPAVATIEVIRQPRFVLDGPSTTTPLSQPFRVFGWAADITVPTGTGVDLIEVTARPALGGPDVLLGTATLGLVRTDVDAELGIVNLSAGWEYMVSGLAPGQRYTLIARARYTATGEFELSAMTDVVIAPDALEADRSSVIFAQAGTTHTGAQSIRVTTSSGSPLAWSASLDDPFNVLELRSMAGVAGPISGIGAGTFQIAIRDGAAVPGASLRLGSVRFTAAEASGVPEVAIELQQVAPAAPWGYIDTPLHEATVSGAIGVTGWALDDVEVTRVTIYRDPVGGESGETFIGDAVFVDGARPDVAAYYPITPRNTRAGWGLSLLTNMLPNQGNGTFRLHAYAHDGNGLRTLLGSKTITGANDTATLPFGTIDAPAQGATVSGQLVMFGWVLTPGPAIVPTDGSTIAVRVDGQMVGRPTYNQCRGTNGTNFPAAGTCNDDVAALFGAGYRNIAEGSGAIGSFVLDTTTLTNGLHQIDWLVTDSLGRVQGIGSRLIYVQN
jgi:DNA-binding beta-propeller fold protein YncE